MQEFVNIVLEFINRLTLPEIFGHFRLEQEKLEENQTSDQLHRFTSPSTDMDEFRHIKQSQKHSPITRHFKVPFPVEIL
jgi:hypothetical protein